MIGPPPAGNWGQVNHSSNHNWGQVNTHAPQPRSNRMAMHAKPLGGGGGRAGKRVEGGGPTNPFPKFFQKTSLPRYNQPTSRRMGIGKGCVHNASQCLHSQSSAVLGVKPAYEDVDVGSFLAFLTTLVEDRIVPNMEK